MQGLLSGLPNTPAKAPAKQLVMPTDLPLDIEEKLLAYKARVDERYARLIKNGHDRSPDYTYRRILEPVRFAVFCAGAGVTRWDAIRQRDVVAFLKDNPAVNPSRLKAFLNFIEGARAFRDRRGQSARKRKADARNINPPKVIAPEHLKAFLDDVRVRYSTQEFLLAWLVCSMGMTAKEAYELSIDRVRTDDQGRVVIRPAEVWVVTPKHISGIFDATLRQIIPSWPVVDAKSSDRVTIFDHFIGSLSMFTAKVLQGRSTVLRASAVFAAMMRGNFDRVTLKATMGVSTITIAKLELLLSADLHHKVAPDLVKARNDVILGLADG